MDETPPRVAGGCLLAAMTLAGAALGVWAGEATAGLLAGFAAGAAAAVILAVWDARRRR